MPGLGVYRVLSRSLFPGSLRARLIALVLICTVLPLVGLVVWLLNQNGAEPEHLIAGLVAAVALTILGVLVCLFLIYHLLAPLRWMVDAVEAYRQGHRLPDLPEDGRCELGQLMRAVNFGLREIDQGVQELERFALEDPLTHAFNRRGIERILVDFVDEAERHGTPLALYVIDLDNLKLANDLHGHAAGDRMLVELVESAEAWLGERDRMGRLGGDEFLLCVRESVHDASPKVDAWLAELASRHIDDIPIRVSAGCAAFRPGLDALTLYREADAAMYKAKSAGGSQLVCDASPMAFPVHRDEPVGNLVHSGNESRPG